MQCQELLCFLNGSLLQKSRQQFIFVIKHEYKEKPSIFKICLNNYYNYLVFKNYSSREVIYDKYDLHILT